MNNMKYLFPKAKTLPTAIFFLASLLSFSATSWAENITPGIQALNEGRFNDAENHFKNDLNTPSLRNEALLGLSRVYLAKGNAETATTFIEQALLLKPTTAEKLLLSGDIYCNQAQKASMFSALKLAKKCIGQYEAAISNEPNNTDAVVTALRFHFEVPAIAGGSQKRGNELLEKLKILSPESANTHKMMSLNTAGDTAAALKLAEELTKKGFQSEQNQYEVAHFYREQKNYAQAKPLFENLILRPTTIKNQWYINDGLLQLGEILLIENKDLNRSIELLEKHKLKNFNPEDKHYFWSTWSLAKAYKAAGKKDKYDELVKKIKSEDYKNNSAFAKEFEAAI